ncbi:MAG: polysaccharide biosynthesis/export family protein [Terriglobia bacterium]
MSKTFRCYSAMVSAAVCLAFIFGIAKPLCGMGGVTLHDDAGKNQPPSPVVPHNNDYIIGTEDVISVNVWKEPDISRAVPVRPDGKISLPLVGEIQASGLTPMQLQSQVTEKLEAFVAHPQVTVIIQQVKSQRFNIVGEVQRPGEYDLAKPMTVLDAIALAGGFVEFAKTNKVYILRRAEDGSTRRIPFNYKQVAKGKGPGQDVRLQSGDTIIVP